MNHRARGVSIIADMQSDGQFRNTTALLFSSFSIPCSSFSIPCVCPSAGTCRGRCQRSAAAASTPQLCATTPPRPPPLSRPRTDTQSCPTGARTTTAPAPCRSHPRWPSGKRCNGKRGAAARGGGAAAAIARRAAVARAGQAAEGLRRRSGARPLAAPARRGRLSSPGGQSSEAAAAAAARQTLKKPLPLAAATCFSRPRSPGDDESADASPAAFVERLLEDSGAGVALGNKNGLRQQIASKNALSPPLNAWSQGSRRGRLQRSSVSGGLLRRNRPATAARHDEWVASRLG